MQRQFLLFSALLLLIAIQYVILRSLGRSLSPLKSARVAWKRSCEVKFLVRVAEIASLSCSEVVYSLLTALTVLLFYLVTLYCIKDFCYEVSIMKGRGWHEEFDA